jgi:DNA-binding response OmpR family regulator
LAGGKKGRHKKMAGILLIEDDLALADVISFTLRRAGFQVATLHDGVQAMAQWAAIAPQLILLDLTLPRLDGLAVCRKIRTESALPIIILSARSGDEAIVTGLELGADDYIVKPFSPTQLVARVKAVLRRSSGVQSQPAGGSALGFDATRRTLAGPNGESQRLTQLESRLLETLAPNSGIVMPADTLIDTVWGADGGDRAMLKQLVYRLRLKLEQQGAVALETIPGIGYVLQMKNDA